MGPIRGQTRPMPVTAGIVPEVQHIDAKLNASIHNRFDIEVIDSVTGEVRQRAQAENVVLNQWWTQFGLSADGNNFYSLGIGSGSGTPAATDTALFTSLSTLSYSTDAADTVETASNDTMVYSVRKKCTINETSFVGSAITELGIISSSSKLVTHAMLKDLNGNAISIVKTSTDIINFYATVFVHLLKTNNVLFTGCDLLAAIPLCQILSGFNRFSTSVNGYLGFKSSIVASSLAASRTYNSASKTITFTFPRVSAASLNGYGGFNCVAIKNGITCYASNNNGAAGFMSGADVIGEAIGTGDGSKKDFATAFGYVGNAKIYVNGVQDTTVTVDEGRPYDTLNNFVRYMRIIDGNGNSVGLVRPLNMDGGSSSTYFLSDAVGDPETIFENPYYQTIGITGFTIDINFGSHTIKCSDDLATWTSLGSGSSVTVDSAHQKTRYWKVVWASVTFGRITKITPTTTSNSNIHFASAPASGSVITSDYHTDTIAKDANHVFDFSLTIQLGEHTS